MLHLLDESLEAFLRATVPLPAREVDVVFASPDGDWAAGVSRPTIDLYLWDLRLNLADRESGLATVPGTAGGRAHREEPMPRVDCRYLITAWTSDVRDEHSLLGKVLGAVLRNPVVEAEHLRGGYADVRPLPTIGLRAGDGSDNADLWSALGGKLRPGLDVVVTATVDVTRTFEAGPPVEEVLLRQRFRDGTGDGDVVIASGPTATAAAERAGG